MSKLYVASAPVVKVAVGPANGNRVARIIKRGGVIPEGVDQDKLDQLEQRGLIEALSDPEDTAAAEAEATAAAKAKAAAEAKAAADAKAAGEAEAKAKAAAAKTTPAK